MGGSWSRREVAGFACVNCGEEVEGVAILRLFAVIMGISLVEYGYHSQRL